MLVENVGVGEGAAAWKNESCGETSSPPGVDDASEAAGLSVGIGSGGLFRTIESITFSATLYLLYSPYFALILALPVCSQM